MFTSQIGANEPVIDDDNYEQHVTETAGMPRGRDPRNYRSTPEGALPGASRFNAQIIPRSEWVARIQGQEQRKIRPSDIAKRRGLKPLNQANTNYCWCNAVVMAVMVIRAFSNLFYVLLSPASVAAVVKNFRNVGGWGGEALEYIVENGVAPQTLWPPNAINRRYYTDEVRAEARNYRVTEWWELSPRNFDQLATCLLMGIPVAIGLNWWSHEVLAMDLVYLGKDAFGRDKFGVRILNSWGEGYGEGGYAILSESKATPDDAVAPRYMTAA